MDMKNYYFGWRSRKHDPPPVNQHVSVLGLVSGDVHLRDEGSREHYGHVPVMGSFGTDGKFHFDGPEEMWVYALDVSVWTYAPMPSNDQFDRLLSDDDPGLFDPIETAQEWIAEVSKSNQPSA